MKALQVIRKILSLLFAAVIAVTSGSLFMQNGSTSAPAAATLPPMEISTAPVGTEESISSITADPAEPGAPVEAAPAEPTPVPVVMVNVLGTDYPSDTRELDLSGRGRDAILSAAESLGQFSGLERIVLGSENDGLSWDDISRIHSAAPGAALDYAFTLYGTAQNLANETVNLSHVPVGDRGAAVTAVLPYMTRCTYLDMDTCGVGHEDMDAIRQAFPNVNVVWRVNFKGYSVRTDCERILASKPSIAGELHDEDVWVLKYCNGCRYLDLGHNESLTNIEFVRGMPNLEVAIIAMNPIRDLSPLAECPHLEYLETQTTSITDLSPLANLKELRHLNICKLPGLYDISPLFNLPDLMRLWIGSITPIPAEQVEQMRQIAPACEIDTSVVDPTTGTWRIQGYIRVSLPLYSDVDFEQEVLSPRYYKLQEQFGYKDQDFSFASNDPLY